MEWFLLAITSALFSAAAAVTEKKALFTQDALEFSYLVSLFSFLFSIPFFLAVDYETISYESLLVLFGKTILGVFAFWNVMLALKNMEISGALPLLALTPGFVALFAFLILGESLSITEIAGMFCLIAGTYTLEMKTGKQLLHPFTVFYNSKNHRYITTALFLFTLTTILDKYLLTGFKLPPVAFMAFQQLFFAVFFLVIVLAVKKNAVAAFRTLDKPGWTWILMVALFSVAYRYSQIEAFKIAPVALVLSIKRLSVLFAAVGGGKIFNETNLIRKAIATVILITGTILILRF